MSGQRAGSWRRRVRVRHKCGLEDRAGHAVGWLRVEQDGEWQGKHRGVREAGVSSEPL